VQARFITIPQAAGCQANTFDCFTVNGLRFGPDHNLRYLAAQLFPPYTRERWRVTLAGIVTPFPLPQHGFGGFGFAVDPAGNLWYSIQGNTLQSGPHVWIGKITISGAHESITEFALPAPDLPASIAAGPDGNMWFFDDGTHAIGKMTPAGAITEYPLPYAGRLSETAQEDMIPGADHNLWFTDPRAGVVGRITPGGRVTTCDVRANTNPRDLLAAPDGSIWFRDEAQQAPGHIPLGGQLAFYPLHAPITIDSSPAIGPDGNLRATLYNQIGRVTAAGAVTLYDVPSLAANLRGIVTGADHHLWFVEYYPGIIGELTP
jgi:virginiamycin B lyase